FYLGNNTGITHRYIDNNVENGRTYYYAVVAYDFGAPNLGPGISPSENNAVIELDEAEAVRNYGKNVAIMTPRQNAAGYIPPEIAQEEGLNNLGTGTVIPEILASASVRKNHSYVVTFGIDTIKVNSSAYEHDLFYTTSSFSVFNETDSNRFVYSENSEGYAGKNMVFTQGDSLLDDGGYNDFWALNPTGVTSDVFDGLQLAIDAGSQIPTYSYSKSTWLVGDGSMLITPTSLESRLLAWDYEIIFTGPESPYVANIKSGSPRDVNNTKISDYSIALWEQSFDFYVQNTSFTDTSGFYEKFDMVVSDLNGDSLYNPFVDEILVGPPDDIGKRWRGTAFTIRFTDSTDYPEAGDVYRVKFNRSFYLTDSIRFAVNFDDSLDATHLRTKMDSIKVVPNPYIVTNMMETAVSNPTLNQRRKLMFTHIPAECTIHIFSVSGTLIDRIDVENADPENGIVHWDMLTREGLEIAAGMYLYHIESTRTGETRTGKFAVIK
ncbi:hypothetical protein HQ531_05450, partial [bacterium]|nr:hypothetical protein [bacterium]